MQTQNRLAERKTIDRAKALLMKHRGLDEDAAYQLLRKTAMNQSRRIAQVAESVLLAAELFDRGDKS
jgi:response regulator NasT